MPKYKNPPVREIGFSIQFEETEEAVWQKTISSFVKENDERFPYKETAVDRTVEFNSWDGKQIDKIIVSEQVRQYNLYEERRNKVVVISKDQLSVRLLYDGQDHIEYALLDDFVDEMLASYMEICKPEMVRRVELIYVDDFEIPFHGSNKLELSEYFTISIASPDSFPDITNMDCRFAFMPNEDDCYLHLRICRMPNSLNDCLNLRAFWNVFVAFADETPIELTLIKEKTESIHQYLLQSFEKFVTEKCRSLFE